MFDRYIIGGARTTHSYNRTEVTEKRAPTDDSVKLLREMEDKALSSVVDGFLTTGNSLEVVGLKASVPGFGQLKWHYGYRLNGKLYEGTIEGPSEMACVASPVDAYRKVIARLAEHIAHELVESEVHNLDVWKRG